MKLIYPYGAKTSASFGTMPTTKLLLKVDSPHGPLPFIFLFDTGADVSSLPISAAAKLGIDIDSCPQEPMSGYEGTTISVFRSDIKIHFGKKVFAIPCVFHSNEDVPILLGRAGILDRFTIILDGKKKQIIFDEL